jgi:hypothetical protein
MQDEQLDDIIKEAADAYQPAFDEGAWTAMRQQLDRHLPQPNRRRRYLLLLLLLAVVGGGIAYMWWPGSKGQPLMAKTDQPVFPQANDVATAIEQPANATPQQAPNEEAVQGGDVDGRMVPQAVQSLGQSSHPINRPFVRPSITARAIPVNNKANHRAKVPSVGMDEKGDTVASDTVDAVPDKSMVPVGADTDNRSSGTSPTTVPIDTAAAPPTEPAMGQPLAKANPPKPGKGPAQRWALLVSAGADRSHVRWGRGGKTTLAYGIGLGYAIGRHWMVRAGFYQVEKIYSGGKEDYTLPPQAANNPYLYQIDGRCRVQEIPVSILWKTDRPRRHQWFASAGLASLLMKTEQYEYLYKNAAGATYSRSHGIRNENNHYFSVLSLSAGYEYRLGKRLSMMAEPYARVPLKGVGLGKVRLHSLGVLLTVAIRPFAR